MSCLLAILTRKGGVSTSAKMFGGISTNVQKMPGIFVSLQKATNITETFTRKGGLRCRLYQACSSSIRRPYLKIEPTIVWVLAGHTENDVISNTEWNIQ